MTYETEESELFGCVKLEAHIVLKKLSLLSVLSAFLCVLSLPDRLSPCQGPKQLNRKSISVFSKVLTKVLELNLLGLAWVACPSLYSVVRRVKLYNTLIGQADLCIHPFPGLEYRYSQPHSYFN